MQSIIKKFTNLFTHERDIYINAARVNEQYKKLKGNSKVTQVPMINKLRLDYIVVYRRGPNVGTIANIDINSNKFVSTMMNIFVKLNQLIKHKQLMERIKTLPDINNEDYNLAPMGLSSDHQQNNIEHHVEEEKPSPDEILTNDDLPIIELQDHEKFRDINDEIFDIEVRGERAKDKIYFKAKDISQFFGITRLTEQMLRNDQNQTFKINEDYYIPLLVGSSNLQRINHDHIYLTLQGLLRVVFVSRSDNENIIKTLDWIVGLVYTHKFGSDEERQELAKDLFKHILNDKLSGLYYIDLGPLNELYDSMNISKETYPPETYGDHHIGKYGFSENIQSRICDHKNKTNGYGRWSKNIVHKYSVLLSPSQLSRAEKNLCAFLTMEGVKFNYADPNGKLHTELILVPPTKEAKIRSIYKDMLKLYPSKENELAQQILDTEAKYEAMMNAKIVKMQQKLMKEQHRTTEAEKELAIKNEQTKYIESCYKMQLMEANHKAEILQLQMELIAAKSA